MATKKTADSPTSTHDETAAPHDTEESSRNIWLAGLGAFAKAQAEGSRAFEALVSEGVAMQRQAQERIAEATHRMEELTRAGGAATARWGKIETIFEDRVARAAERLGLPSAQDLAQLNERLDRLEKLVSPSAASAAPAKTRAQPVPSRQKKM